MAESRNNDDTAWFGTNRFRGEVALPPGTIGDEEVEAGAAVQATKLQHQYKLFYAQAVGADNADATMLLDVTFGQTAEIIAVECANQVTAGGADTTTVDVTVDGVSILDAIVTLDAAAGIATQSATIDSGELVAGNKVRVVINATGATPGEGVWVRIIVREDAD